MQTNTPFHPEAAIILSAGMAKRMRPISAITPKPLVKLAGKEMLDRRVEELVNAGVKTCVINLHYLADLVEAHSANLKDIDIQLSDERDELLDTGGGIKKALLKLGEKPFVVMNADSVWLEGVKSNLEIMSRTWDPEKMDILLLTARTVNSVGYDGKGDFFMDKDGLLARRKDRETAPYVYSGTCLIKPELFKDAPEGPFSLNLLFDRAIAHDRLFGVKGAQQWLHVGTPEALQEAEKAIAESVN